MKITSHIAVRRVLLATLAAGCQPIGAATIQVDAPGTGPCTLRNAVQAANTDAPFAGCSSGLGADTLILQAAVYTINAGASGVYSDEDANVIGDLDVASVITIQGTNTTQTMIVGPPFDRVFEVLGSPASLTINDVTIVGGSVSGSSAPEGGVVKKRSGGLLTINRSVLRSGLAAQGGGIAASAAGTLTLNSVSIFDSQATVSGGGLALLSTSEALLNNITLSGNFAVSGGGMVSIASAFRLRNSTIARNTAQSGGGISYQGSNSTGINLANSILLDNTGAFGAASDLRCPTGVQIGARSYTMIGVVESCTFASFSGIPASNDARLSPLFNYGGGLQMHALLPGSAAVNAGNPSSSNPLTACLPLDARGLSRLGVCDIGAYEEVYDATVNSFSDTPDTTPGDGACIAAGNVCTLRAAVMEGSARGGRWIVRVPGGTYSLSRPFNPNNDADGGDLDVKPIADVTPALAMALIGPGDSNPMRIVGSGTDRVLDVRSRISFIGAPAANDRSLSFALIGATISNGELIQDPFGDPILGLTGGGITINGGHTLLYNVVINNNHVDLPVSRGGGISIRLVSAGTSKPYLSSVHMERFAVVDNSASNPGFVAGDGNTYALDGGITADSVQATSITDGIVMINGTIAGNRSNVRGGMLMNGSVYAAFLTITDNESDPNPGGFDAGGVYVVGSDNTVRNSLIAGNRIGTAASDCNGLVSLGYNLIGASTGCAISGDTASNLLNVDPQLGPREISSAGMPMYRLSISSPADDVVARNVCADGKGARVLSDARGVERPQGVGGYCDIGATEGDLLDIIFADDFE